MMCHAVLLHTYVSFVLTANSRNAVNFLCTLIYILCHTTAICSEERIQYSHDWIEQSVLTLRVITR